MSGPDAAPNTHGSVRGANPIKGKAAFDPVVDFPARNYHKFKSLSDEDDKPNVVTATFELSDGEVEAIEAAFGGNVLKSKTFEVHRGYSPGRTFSLEVDEKAVVNHLVSQVQLLEDQKLDADALATVVDLRAFIAELVEPHSTAQAVAATIDAWRSSRPTLGIIDQFLMPGLPKFFYFDEYSTMPGRIAVNTLKAKIDAGAELTEGERAFQAFLALGGADLAALQAGTRTEAMFRELENAGITITAEAMQFWTQNEGLRVLVRESTADPNDEDANLRDGQILNLRIENTQQFGVSSPFDERSRGFVWFFSFLAYFTGLEREHGDAEVILLLDEPGLSLHGSAQADFLRFINDRLSLKHQVIYTTHSPFLVEPDRFDRVRTVEDVPTDGTKVSSDVFRSAPGTSLPILTKMGVDLFQTLMVGPNTLLVEGSSDFLYLKLLSGELVRRRGAPLDERWVLVPVSGIGRFESFFRLYAANKINVAVLMDSSSEDQKLVASLKSAGTQSHIVTIGDVLGTKDADFEDLLGEEFFLHLVEATYGFGEGSLDATTFTSKHPRVVKRLEQHFEENGLNAGRFSHLDPAEYLRANKDLLKTLSAESVAHARQLIDRINALAIS